MDIGQADKAGSDLLTPAKHTEFIQCRNEEPWIWCCWLLPGPLVFTFEPLLLGPLWGDLRDEALFAQVRINPDTGTIEWPNGADLNPVILHDWPEYRERIVAERRARHTVAT